MSVSAFRATRMRPRSRGAGLCFSAAGDFSRVSMVTSMRKKGLANRSDLTEPRFRTEHPILHDHSIMILHRYSQLVVSLGSR
jgi:hypothetical protein